MHTTFSIDEATGDVRFLVNDLSRDFVTDPSTVKRASHVVPWNPVLRVLFKLIRYVVGETGSISEWTRQWPCLWQINLSPIGGPIIPVEWHSRKMAIEFEIKWLESNWL